MIEVVSIVPVDDAQLEARPVYDLALRQPIAVALPADKLHQSLDAVEKSRSRIGGDADALRFEHQTIRLLGKRRFVTVG